MKNQNNPRQIAQILPMWTSRAVAIFFSLVLLSESTVANVGGYGLKIAQHTVPAPSGRKFRLDTILFIADDSVFSFLPFLKSFN